MDAEARAAAERKMARRDRKEDGRADGPRRRNRAPAFLRSDSEDEGERGLLPARRRRRRAYDEVPDQDEDDYDSEMGKDEYQYESDTAEDDSDSDVSWHL